MPTCGRWVSDSGANDADCSGMVLHKLLFLRLPYEFTEDLQRLHVEIVAYSGFEATASLVETCERRHIPRNVLLLLEKLLHLSPDQRPSAERVRLAIDTLRTGSMRKNASSLWRKKANSTGADASDSLRNVRVVAMPTDCSSIKNVVLNQAHRSVVYWHFHRPQRLLLLHHHQSRPLLPGRQARLPSSLAA